MIIIAMAIQVAELGRIDSSQTEPPVPSSSIAQASPPPASIGRTESGVNFTPKATAADAAMSTTSYPVSFFAASQPNTAYDMIARLPGFTFDDGGSVRGYGGAAGNVVIDSSRPASKNDDLVSVLTRIPASQVERIDVIRGGAPGIDMQGKAVIANVIRKKGAKTSLSASIAGQVLTSDGGLFPRVRLEASHESADGRSWNGSFSAARQFDDGVGDGLRFTSDGRSVSKAVDNAKVDQPDFTATAGYAQPLWSGQLRINASGEISTTNSTERVATITGVVDDSDERDVQHVKLGEIGANYTKPISATLSSETVFLQQLTHEDYLALIKTSKPDAAIDEQLFRERHTNSETIARETLTWTVSRKLTVQGGAEGDYNLLNSHTELVDNGLTQLVPAANVSIDEKRGEVFSKATLVASPKFQIELGLRLEGSQIRSSGDVALAKALFYPKPRMLVTWSPDGHDQFRLRLEREVGQLDFTSFVATSSFSTGQVRVGNPNLVPQQADVIEGTWERRILKDGAAVVTLRHSELTDVVDRAPVFGATSVFDAPANIGSGHENEALIDATIPLGTFGLHGGLLKADTTWRQSSVVDPTVGNDRSISGLRPFEAKLTFTQDIPRSHLSLGASINRGWTQTYFYFNQIERDHVLPFGSVQAEYKPLKGLSLLLEMYEIGTGIDRTITSWSDTRRSGRPNLTENRNLRLGPAILFRVRKDV